MVWNPERQEWAPRYSGAIQYDHYHDWEYPSELTQQEEATMVAKHRARAILFEPEKSFQFLPVHIATVSRLSTREKETNNQPTSPRPKVYTLPDERLAAEWLIAAADIRSIAPGSNANCCS